MGTKHKRSPWWWKLFGLAFIGGGLALLLVPGWIGATALWERLVFAAGAVVFVFIGAVALKSEAPSGTVACPACGCEHRRSKLIYYCSQCGHVLNPDKDELAASEINCPYCDEPISKGVSVCPQCSKTLPGFGIANVKGRPSCLWCKTPVEHGQKFCSWCSAPLASSRAERREAARR